MRSFFYHACFGTRGDEARVDTADALGPESSASSLRRHCVHVGVSLQVEKEPVDTSVSHCFGIVSELGRRWQYCSQFAPNLLGCQREVEPGEFSEHLQSRSIISHGRIFFDLKITQEVILPICPDSRLPFPVAFNERHALVF
jgi:hypothetical protein